MPNPPQLTAPAGISDIANYDDQHPDHRPQSIGRSSSGHDGRDVSLESHEVSELRHRRQVLRLMLSTVWRASSDGLTWHTNEGNASETVPCHLARKDDT